MRIECAICGVTGRNRLQQHHLVPRRYGGTDTEENLVTLCAGCHQAIEKIYDDTFFERFKRREDNVGRECIGRECTNPGTKMLHNPRPEKPEKEPVCDDHRGCAAHDLEISGEKCSGELTNIVPEWSGNGKYLACENHAICGHEECYARDIFFLRTKEEHFTFRCYNHAKEYDKEYYWG